MAVGGDIDGSGERESNGRLISRRGVVQAAGANEGALAGFRFLH